MSPSTHPSDSQADEMPPVAAPLEVDPSALETSSPVDYSSASDLDLANILYIQNIPLVPDNKKNELDARIKSMNSWLAFELTRVEKLVQDKIKGGQLPGDDSVASKSKRTGYRSKVVNAHRGDSTWLTMASTTTKTSTTTAGEDKINIAILRSILGASGISNSPQVLNVVKATGAGLNGLAQTVQPHVFYIIDYYHDPGRDSIAASIKSFFFNVTVTEAPTPAPGKGGLFHRGDSAPAANKGKSYNATVEYTNTSVTFDFDRWDKNAPKDVGQYAVGKELLAQKQLRLLKEF